MIIVAVICAWCKKTLEIRSSDEAWDEAEDGYCETHSICEECSAQM